MRGFILLAALMSFTQTSLALDQAKVLKSLQSVVMIRGYNSNGGLAYGSGVVVEANKVITNCHIFRSTSAPWVTRGEDTYEIESVQADRWHDLCLVTAKIPFTPAPIGSSDNIKREQEVLSIGHSNGVLVPITSAGVIKTTYNFDGGKVIRSSAKFLMGASGSGIFDTEGNLLGINTFKTPGRPAYFYSLPIEWLADLKKLPAETKFPITGKAFWEEDDDKKPFFMQMAIPEINQDWPKLEQIAGKWTETYPKDTEAWFELGLAQEKLNKVDDAKQSYLKSVAIDANNTSALFRLGVIAQSQGDKSSMSSINSTIAKIDENLAKEFSEMLGCNIHC